MLNKSDNYLTTVLMCHTWLRAKTANHKRSGIPHFGLDLYSVFFQVNNTLEHFFNKW